MLEDKIEQFDQMTILLAFSTGRQDWPTLSIV